MPQGVLIRRSGMVCFVGGGRGLRLYPGLVRMEYSEWYMCGLVHHTARPAPMIATFVGRAVIVMSTVDAYRM